MSSSHWQMVPAFRLGRLGRRIFKTFLLLSVLLLNTGEVAQANEIGSTRSSDIKNGEIGWELSRLSALPSAPELDEYLQTSCATSGDLVIASGETCSLAAGSYTFNSITIQTGGSLVVLSNLSAGSGVTITTNSMVVETGATLTADGQGFARATGPGAGPNGSQAAGGGHGGRGGVGSGTSTGGASYGNVYSPITLGSGGGNGGNGGTGGAGGGAVHLIVGDTLTLNGAISANGQNGNVYFGAGGGGAGGSVWIAATAFAGNGQIRANGGNGYDSYGVSGGGGGGRIAIDVPAAGKSFNGTVMAYGGSGNQYGGAGTVYWTTEDRLVVDNNAHSGAATGLVSGNYQFDRIDIRRQGILRILGAASALTFDAGTLSGSDGTGRLESEGAFNTPADLVISTVTLVILNDISGAMNITTQTAGGLELHAGSVSHPNGVFSFINITIKANTVLRLVPYDGTQNDYGVTLQVENLTVELNGTVTSNGLGYKAATGPGAGPNGAQAAGGGHGGQGGRGSGTSVGGATYGNVFSPITFGSGGGNGGNGGTGGAGGGALRLVVNDTLTLNGIVSANGLNGNTYFGAGGGGAGGSIWIAATTLAGNGQIRANGGNGFDSYGLAGGGGGGRIAIYADSLSTSLIYSANGGTGYQAGGAGSIFFGGIDPTNSTVQISPASLTADGMSLATVTVTLRNIDNYPIPGEPVEISIISGSSLNINSQVTSPGQYVSIGSTDANGRVTATLRTATTGIRVIQARSSQVTVGQQGTVEFLPGPVSASASSVSALPAQVPADGGSFSTVTVIARDANNNPVPGAGVVLQASGGAVITQPTGPTDNLGRASGTVSNTVGGTVTISATVNGLDLQDTAVVTFTGADLTLSLSAPTSVVAGYPIQYTLTIRNASSITGRNVSLEMTLPGGVSYSGANSPVPPTQNGQTLVWGFGDFSPGMSMTFIVYGEVSASAAVGTTLTAQAAAATETYENNTANNAADRVTQVVDGYVFDVNLTPATRVLAIGGSGVYTITVKNTGALADTFNISVSGLGAGLYSLSQDQVTLPAGGTGAVQLSIQSNDCSAAGQVPFQVTVTGAAQNEAKTASAAVTFQTAPVISNMQPKAGLLLGSRNVAVSWSTDVTSTGILNFYPQGQPENSTTFQTPAGQSHAVVVPDLERNATYEWFIQADSSCGSGTSSPRQFTIGNGVVFKSHEQTYTIDRDYDQTVMVPVTNQDSVSHSVHLEIVHSYEDLTVNFRGSGSINNDITLLPGETRSVELAFFAQDAALKKYDISALLTSSDGGETISDLAVIHVNVLFESDYTVEEIGFDPLMNTITYRVTNHGQPITDLNISAVDPLTGLPASVLITPQVYHARLGTGQSIEFKAIPLYSLDQVSSVSNLASTLRVLARPSQPALTDIIFDILSTVNGVPKRTRALSHCDGSIYAVTIDGPVAVTIPFKTWYCPNRPNVFIKLMLPLFAQLDNLLGGALSLNFSPSAIAESHDMTISMNGNLVGSTENAIPDGTYSFNLDPSTINTGFQTNAEQTIAINADFNNFAHYQIGSDGSLVVVMDQVTVFVCADSQEQAEQVAMDLYGFKILGTMVDVQIRKPASSAAEIDSNGFVNVQAFVGDNAQTYYNFYSVTAEVEYLDQPGTPSETFLMFDDGEIGHADAAANDRYFNANWRPRHGGSVRLTVTVRSPQGLSDTDSRTFTIDAQPDFEVSQVFIKKLARKNEAVEVFADVRNNGFSVNGPVALEFRYYATNADGEKIGTPVHVTQMELFGNIFNPVFDHGEMVTIRDNQFIAPRVAVYFVEVVVDP